MSDFSGIVLQGKFQTGDKGIREKPVWSFSATAEAMGEWAFGTTC